MAEIVTPSIKVLYLIGSLYYGGAQTQLVELATHLDSQRLQPTVGVLRASQQAAGPLHRAGIPLIHFRRRMKYDPTVVFRVARFLRRRRIDVLHTWLFSAGAVGCLASFLAATPVVVHSERGFPTRFKGGSSTLGRSLRDRLVNSMLKGRTDALVANSDSLGKYLEVVEGHDKSKIRVIYNGLNWDRVTPRSDARDRLRNELGVSEDQTLVGMIANLAPEKNHLLFIELAERVLSRLEDIAFVLVGDDVTPSKQFESYKSRVLQRLRASPDSQRIHYVGYRADIPELLAAVDIFVLTSDFESMPNVLLEAAGRGLPTVSTESSDLASLLQEGEGGVMVPKGDAQAMAQAVVALADDPARAKALGARGRLIVKERFSVEHMASATQELYLTLLDGKRGPGKRRT